METKSVKVQINLDFDAEIDENGEIDEFALKECVYLYLSELLDDESLAYEVLITKRGA